MVREIVSNKNLRAQFINKVHGQYKTLLKAFTDMNKLKTGFIVYEELKDMIKGWGFEATE
jgi:Ca2+-binding EF-hand superfamily protein